MVFLRSGRLWFVSSRTREPRFVASPTQTQHVGGSKNFQTAGYSREPRFVASRTQTQRVGGTKNFQTAGYGSCPHELKRNPRNGSCPHEPKRNMWEEVKIFKRPAMVRVLTNPNTTPEMVRGDTNLSLRDHEPQP